MMKPSACLLLLFLSLVLGQKVVFAQNGAVPIQVVAHRGAHQEVPENTLQAFKKAIFLGLDYIEVDLRTSRDGELVVFHDSSLDRMTGMSGRIEDFDLAELQGLPLLYRGKASFRYRIPSFEEVLQVVRGRVKIYLDFKEAEVEQAWALLQKYQMQDQLIVYVNSHEQAKAWRAIAPQVPLMVSLPDSVKDEESLKAFLQETEVEMIDGKCEEYTDEMIRMAHQLGVQVWIDVQSPDENSDIWENCLRRGIDALQTDHSKELTRYLRKKNQ